MTSVLSTALAVAVIRLNTEHVRVEQTLKERCWFNVSGGAGNGATAAGAGPVGAGPNQRRCSDSRRKSWNCCASVGAGTYDSAAASAGRTVSPCSEKVVLTPGTPEADCGTTK